VNDGIRVTTTWTACYCLESHSKNRASGCLVTFDLYNSDFRHPSPACWFNLSWSLFKAMSQMLARKESCVGFRQTIEHLLDEVVTGHLLRCQYGRGRFLNLRIGPVFVLLFDKSSSRASSSLPPTYSWTFTTTSHYFQTFFASYFGPH
jgi:hypothetical protein